MNTVLDVTYIGFFIWGVAANTTAQLDRLVNAPIRRWHHFVMSLTVVGALAYIGAPAFLYWVAFVLTVGFATAEDATVKPLNWRRVGTTFALLSVGFWLPALAFGFQPAPVYGALVLIVPAMLGTYVPFLRDWFQKNVVNVCVTGAKKLKQLEDARRADNERRADWLSRR